MSEGRVEQLRDLIIGLRPVYTDRGNATELWLVSGEIILDRRGIKSVQSALARSYALDLKAQREQLGQLLNRSVILPFYLGRRVFVPLKMRRALTGNDMVYGYFDGGYIEDIQGGKQRNCRVWLKTGVELECYSSEATAKKSLHLGLELQGILDKDNGAERDERMIVEAITAVYRSFREILLRLQNIEGSIAEAHSIYRSGREH